MTTDSDVPIDDSSEGDKPIKKCPICFDGVLEFEGGFVEAWGDCNNKQNHEVKYDGFEVINLDPFTVKHHQAPLRTYVIPVENSGLLTEEGMKFTLRDAEDHDSVVEAVLLSLEGMLDWVQHELPDSIGWGEVEWGDYEEHDDGITEYILEEPEVESE